MPDPPEITRTALQCETTVIDNMERKLINLHRPQCTNPRLLSLVPLYSDAVTEMQVWPKFKSNFFGPYYTTTGFESSFYLYARANFLNTRVTYTAIGEASVEIPIGNISSLLQFSASDYTKTFPVTVDSMGWKTGVWSSKAQVTYHFVVSRRRHGGDGLKFMMVQTSQRNQATMVMYTR